MGKTSHAKELVIQKKLTFRMSNGPPFEIKQHKTFEIGKSIVSKHLLEGDMQSVDHVARFGVDL
jgi:hypothetical protein